MPSVTVADGPYDLTYRLSRADIAAWLGMGSQLRGFARLLVFVPFIALGAALGYLEDTETGQALGLGDSWVELVLLAAAVAAIYGFIGLFMSLVRSRAIRLAAVPEGEIRLVANRAGVRVTRAGRTVSHAWEEIFGVALGASHVFLTTGPDAAIIVPERAFADREEMLRFATFADAAMHAAGEEADARMQVVQRAGKP